MTAPSCPGSLVSRVGARFASIVALIALCAPNAARASDDKAPTPASAYTLDAWYADDGLPQQMVTASAQTGDGYLWLGTEEGLARFDGARFQTFDRRNTPTMAAGGRIAALATAPDGSLWVGTDADGLLHLVGGTFVRRWPASGRAVRVRDIAITRQGVVWIATPEGLVRIDGETTRNVRTGRRPRHQQPPLGLRRPVRHALRRQSRRRASPARRTLRDRDAVAGRERDRLHQRS